MHIANRRAPTTKCTLTRQYMVYTNRTKTYRNIFNIIEWLRWKIKISKENNQPPMNFRSIFQQMAIERHNRRRNRQKTLVSLDISFFFFIIIITFGIDEKPLLIIQNKTMGNDGDVGDALLMLVSITKNNIHTECIRLQCESARYRTIAENSNTINLTIV